MTSPLNRELGERIRRLREEAGLTLRYIEERTGGELKFSNLSALERAEKVWQAHHLEAVAKAIGVAPRDLLPRVAPPLTVGRCLEQWFDLLLDERQAEGRIGRYRADRLVQDGDGVSLESATAGRSDKARSVVGFAGSAVDLYEDLHTARRETGRGPRQVATIGEFVVTLDDYAIDPVPSWTIRRRDNIWWAFRAQEARADIARTQEEKALIDALREGDLKEAARRFANLAEMT